MTKKLRVVTVKKDPAPRLFKKHRNLYRWKLQVWEPTHEFDSEEGAWYKYVVDHKWFLCFVKGSTKTEQEALVAARAALDKYCAIEAAKTPATIEECEC